MTKDTPIATIKLKLLWYWAALILTIIITIFAITAVIVPVLSSGDFGAVWPASDKNFGRKVFVFFISIFWLVSLPAMFRTLSTGELIFFYDRFEVRPFFFAAKRKIFFYKDITVNQHGSYRVTVHTNKLPGWNHPLRHLEALYINGTSFGLLPRGYRDPTKLPIVLDILKRSTDFNEKSLS